MIFRDFISYFWFIMSAVNMGIGIYDGNLSGTFGWLSSVIAITVIILQDKRLDLIEVKGE